MRRRIQLPFVLLLALAALLATPALAAPADSAILFIGDGMGPVHIQITRALHGGDRLAMETLPFSGFVTTHPAEGEVTDSAAAATALATGVKTKNGMIGLAPDGRRLTTIIERAKAQGKATGIITTDALWGATPAAFATHVPSRYLYADIAAQMAISGVDVLMGFSKDFFLPTSAGGEREDGRNLIAEMTRAGYAFIETKGQFKKVPAGRLLGLFAEGRDAPTLTGMMEAAVAHLSQDPDGFFLMVEGARIDWESHGNDPAGVVLTVSELDAAVASALHLARKREDILVVVTADHETGGLTLQDGERLGMLRRVTMSANDMAGALNVSRTNIQKILTKGAGITRLTPAELTLIRESKEPAKAIASIISNRAGLGWTTTGHTATKVSVFAFGPDAQQFAGELDNTNIPQYIAEIIGLGPLGN